MEFVPVEDDAPNPSSRKGVVFDGKGEAMPCNVHFIPLEKQHKSIDVPAQFRTVNVYGSQELAINIGRNVRVLRCAGTRKLVLTGNLTGLDFLAYRGKVIAPVNRVRVVKVIYASRFPDPKVFEGMKKLLLESTAIKGRTPSLPLLARLEMRWSDLVTRLDLPKLRYIHLRNSHLRTKRIPPGVRVVHCQRSVLVADEPDPDPGTLKVLILDESDFSEMTVARTLDSIGRSYTYPETVWINNCSGFATIDLPNSRVIVRRSQCVLNVIGAKSVTADSSVEVRNRASVSRVSKRDIERLWERRNDFGAVT